MIDGLKAYPSMKDSGVPWLGEVPKHWEVHKLRNLLEPIAERNRPDLPLLSVVREKGVIQRDTTNKDENRNFIPDDLSNYKVVQAGQFAMNKMKAWQGSYGVSQHDGIVSPAYFVFEVSGVEGVFLHTAIRSRAYVSFFGQASDGVRIGQWDLSQARMKEIPFFVPPPSEQTAIVHFLDHTDRRIRKYIRAKQKLIKLLEEEKQAIILRAVTRGLDPNVRLKPSGVEWLGEVPEHWGVVRGKYVGNLFSTPSLGDENLTEMSDSGIMYLKVADLKQVDELLRVTQSKLYVKSNVVKKVEPRAPYLVFPKRGGAIYTNKVGILDSPALLDPNLMGWRIDLRRFEPRFVALLLKTRTLADLADVSSVPQINNKHINPIGFPAPPLKEQTSILGRLDEDLSELGKAVKAAESEIGLLREYRTRLIADVVTGKLDVREAVSRLPEAILEAEPLDETEDMLEDEGVADDEELAAADAA